MQVLDELDLIFRDSPQFTRGSSLSHRCCCCNFRSPLQSTRVRDPIANLVRNNYNNRNTWIVLVAFVNTILEVAEVCRDKLRPVFLDQFLVLGHFGGPAIARPIRSGAIAEADIDVLVVCDFITFLGDVVDDEDEGKLRIFEGPSRVHCARMQKSVSGACCEHSGLCSLHDLVQTYNRLSLKAKRNSRLSH